jgi:hypothetical protein
MQVLLLELQDGSIGKQGPGPELLQLAFRREGNLDIGQASSLVAEDLRAEPVQDVHVGPGAIVPLGFIRQDDPVLGAARRIRG